MQFGSISNLAAPGGATGPAAIGSGLIAPVSSIPCRDQRGERLLHVGDEITLYSEQGSLLLADGHIRKKGVVLEDWNPRSPTTGDLLKAVFRVEPQLAFRDTRVRLCLTLLKVIACLTTIINDRPSAHSLNRM
jgi:hypothetical protein